MSFHDLPNELLQPILIDYVLGAGEVLDPIAWARDNEQLPSLYPFVERTEPKLRYAKENAYKLMRVCRLWSTIYEEFLYSSIGIGSDQSSAADLTSLLAAYSRKGRLKGVRRMIILYAYDPEENDYKLLEDAIKEMDRLHIFIDFGERFRFNSISSAIQPTCPIHYLHYSSNIFYSKISLITSFARTIRTIEMCSQRSEFYHPLDNSNALELPILEVLMVPYGGLPSYISTWNMPQLRHLVLSAVGDFDESFTSFFEQFGQQIVTIRLDGFREEPLLQCINSVVRKNYLTSLKRIQLDSYAPLALILPAFTSGTPLEEVLIDVDNHLSMLDENLADVALLKAGQKLTHLKQVMVVMNGKPLLEADGILNDPRCSGGVSECSALGIIIKYFESD